MDGELHHFRTGGLNPTAELLLRDVLARQDLQDLVFAYLRIQDDARRAAAIEVTRGLGPAERR